MRTIFLLLLCLLTGFLYSQQYPWLSEYDTTNALLNRIQPPPHFERLKTRPGSFAYWLQRIPLKPGHPMVYLYNGIEKPNQSVHYAVVDIDVGHQDLQQCADAIIRLRAEYLYSRKRYDAIHFNFTSGDRIDFMNWVKGYRPVVRGEAVNWLRSGITGASYDNFKQYLNIIFTYAGTLSLSEELQPVEDVQDMKIGDVFIQGGTPGHAVLVVDMAQNPDTGKKVFLLLQSFMPAQDMHILVNPVDSQITPWYSLDFGDTLVTPEWTFYRTDLKRF
ncbi:MAG: hypothetical protein D6748_02450 [Calditrichaeota bacterium]|nr:MAG: hypothetical protein D6748_02450 [Calditrichota bacterium]